MLDVMATTSYDYHLGALSEYSAQFENSLAVAVNDFTTRGLLVSYIIEPCYVDQSKIPQRGALPLRAWNLICQIPNARWRAFCDSDQIIAKVS